MFYLIDNKINNSWWFAQVKRIGCQLYFMPARSALSVTTITTSHDVINMYRTQCLLIFSQGRLWTDQSCWSRPSCSRVAAEMRSQSEVSRFRTLASGLQRTANWASGQIQDPGNWRHRILHHVQRVWPPGSVLQCGEYNVLVLVKCPTLISISLHVVMNVLN